MKYLIVGLGNIGPEYENTRHNIGFMVLDQYAKENNCTWHADKYVNYTEHSHKGKKLILIKPTTYMNLSGKAVRHWMNAEKIPIENILIITDDLALPFNTLRLKAKGSDAGHNGLKSINELLLSQNYARLRFGIGSDYAKGKQVNYVLGQFDGKEQPFLPELIEKCKNIIQDFCTQGIDKAMNAHNTK